MTHANQTPLQEPPHIWITRDRIAGALVGLLVGDALGVPYEFKRPEHLPPIDQVEYTPPKGYPRTYPDVPPGTWSDDGAQALVLLDSLLHSGGVDLAHFSGGLLRWLHDGFCTADGQVFDVGVQTQIALGNLAKGIPPEASGPRGEMDNGNGSLMRVLPLALWHQGCDAELIADAAQLSLPTHAHPRSMAACALYCLYVRAVLEATDAPWPTAIERFRAVAESADLFPKPEHALLLDPQNADVVKGSGYVVDTLWSARCAFEGGKDFEDCLRRAIALGNDTDTVAAVTGGLAGARFGLSGIPHRWRDALRGQEILQPLLQRLLNHRQPVKARWKGEPRTSASHPLRVASLPLLNGRLGITLCPGKKQADAFTGAWDRDLNVDLAALRDWGASELVTLIEEYEFRELSVENLGEQARANGLHWHHLPIRDQHAPDMAFEQQWARTLPVLKAALQRGKGVVVHCKGGLGRAGTVAALMLLELIPNLSADEAMRRVREVRNGAIESLVQERYLKSMR